MYFSVQLVISDECGSKITEEIFQLEKSSESSTTVGLTLCESKQIMATLQEKIVLTQAKNRAESQRYCSCCGKKRHLKGYNFLQFRTLFGIIRIPSPRLFYCRCDNKSERTFSPISEWLSDKNSPELQYLETKWASLISYQLTAKFLKETFPIGAAQNASTVRNHLQKVAKRKEKELEGKPEYITGCPRDWGALPKPDKPITVGIDGGYLTHWHKKNKNFEIIAGKSFSMTREPKRFGFVQAIDNHP